MKAVLQQIFPDYTNFPDKNVPGFPEKVVTVALPSISREVSMAALPELRPCGPNLHI